MQFMTRTAIYLLPVCLTLCGCPSKTESSKTDLAKTDPWAPPPGKTDAATADKPNKAFPVKTRDVWVANAMKFVKFPRPGRKVMLSFFSSKGEEVEVKLVDRNGSLKVEVRGTPVDAPGALTAASAKGHAVWSRLKEQLAALRAEYKGNSPHGPAVNLLVEPKIPPEVTQEAVLVVAASYPDEAYAKPKRAALEYLLVMPRMSSSVRRRKPAVVVTKRPIKVPEIKTKPEFAVKTRTEWLNLATGFAKEAGARKVALLFFCKPPNTGTPTIDFNELRIKLLLRDGQPVIRVGQKDFNSPGDVTGENAAGHAVWKQLQTLITEKKHRYSGSSPHGLPIRVDVDAGVPIEVTQEVLELATALYHEGTYAKPELPPLQRAYLQSKKR